MGGLRFRFFLIYRHPLADVAARAAAPLGALFTVLGIITGSLWGKPMWGTYWVWDMRLTSFLPQNPKTPKPQNPKTPFFSVNIIIIQ